MSGEAQRELAAVLGSARPGPRHAPKPRPRSVPQKPSGRMFEPLPELLHVEGAIGSASVVFAVPKQRLALGSISTREHEPTGRYECTRCGQPRLQELTDRVAGTGAERWDVLPCPCSNQGDGNR